MMLTGAQILIEALVEQGVDVVFGYPGGSILNIHDALYENRDRIRHILTSHEQGAAHAADGYARASGKVGVCIATSGPGATNLVTGIATAFMDSIPMVAITGNVTMELIGRDSFQEVDITGITMPITKHNYIVKDISKLAETVREAFRIAKEGRPGPVLIDIPKDITAKQAEYVRQDIEQAVIKPETDPEMLGKAVQMIAESKRPLIFAGGGVVFSDASEALQAFAEKIDSPVVLSMMGLSAMPYSHPKNLGMVGMHGTPVSNRATTDCDLLITVGARFSDRVAGKRDRFVPNAKIIHVDIDGSEQGKNVRCDLAVEGDAGDVLRTLTAASEQRHNDEWTAHLGNYEKKHGLPYYEKDNEISMRDVVKALSGLLPENAIIVTDVGQHQMITGQHFEFRIPRTFISSCGLGTMGYGLGAAIGAQVARPDCPVVLVTGDGSFHMNFNELACVESENLPIKVILLNNHVLGMVRQWQRLFYHEHYANTSIDRKTDMIKLAQAFGTEGFRVKEKQELEAVLKKALSLKTHTIVECLIDRDDSVYPIIPPGGDVNDAIYSG